MKRFKRYFFLCLGLLLSFVSIIWIYNLVNWNDVSNAFTKLTAIKIILLILIYSFSFYLRSIRLNFILTKFNNNTLKVAFESICINYFINSFLPFRVGDLVRIVYLNRILRISFINNITFLTYEKFLDFLLITLIFLFLILISNIDYNLFKNLINNINYLMYFLLSVSLILIIFAILYNKIIIFSFYKKLIKYLDQFKHALLILNNYKMQFSLIIISMLIWFLEGGMFVLGAYFLKMDNPILFGFLCLCFVNLGFVIPSTPGHIGIFEASVVFASFAIYNDHSLSLALGIIVHFLQVLSIILINVLWFMYSKKSIIYFFIDIKKIYKSTLNNKQKF